MITYIVELNDGRTTHIPCEDLRVTESGVLVLARSTGTPPQLLPVLLLNTRAWLSVRRDTKRVEWLEPTCPTNPEPPQRTPRFA